MSVFKTLRNNWKKTIFLIAISGVGVHYGMNKYRESLLLRAYCLEAKKYGEILLTPNERRRRVTVFLNPAASKGKGKALFEKNIAPLLHLAGLEVTIIKTEHEGQAKKFMEVLDETDAILVAGGDGTLSEVVTGLLRRNDEESFSRIPLGVLPLGKTNTLASSLCPSSSSPIQIMAELTMSVIKGNAKSVDVIQVVGNEEKSVFAVSGFEWGAFTDSEIAKAKYWYFGPLKHRLAYAVTAVKYWPIDNEAYLSYVLPCDGCSRCYVAPPAPVWKWWHLFLPPTREVAKKDYSSVVNEECGQIHNESLSLSQMSVSTNNQALHSNQEPKSLQIKMVNGGLTKTDFIKEGQKRILKENPSLMSNREISVKEFSITPGDKTVDKGRGLWFLLDNERYELMNLRGQLLADKLRFYFSDSFTVPLENSQRNLP